MKKVLLIALAVSLLSVGSFAASFQDGWTEGTISRISKNSDGLVVIYIIPTGGSVANEVQGTFELSGDERKEFLAVALTARAADKTISLWQSSGQWSLFEF
jgi:hypothetical protein